MIARSYANRGSLSLKRYGNPVLSCFCVMEIVREFYPELDSIKTRKNKWSRVSDIVKGKTWKNI